MIIKSIHLKEGLYERKINFSDTVNLIHSNANSCGKTTLLRFILYGLGYNIPNTKKIKFEYCEVILTIDTKNEGTIILQRTDRISLQMKKNDSIQTFVLPEQQNTLHAIFFGTENADILNNLLGAYYMDQEKGWTLLNRGVVIGSIHFNIEELIRGLSGRDCSDLIKTEAKLSAQITKYKQMFSVAQYRETIQKNIGSIASDSYKEHINTEIDSLLIEQGSLKSELGRINRTLKDNKRFKKFVADLKLLVRSPKGHVFSVTEENIIGLNDSIDILISKRKIVSTKYAKVTNQLKSLYKEKTTEDEQLDFLNSATQEEIFDKSVIKIPLNQVSIKKQLELLQKNRSTIRNQISKRTKLNNKIASQISQEAIRYATELNIGDEESISANYIYTSNLKELSGAILHKTVFAFRLAYIIAIEDVLNIKLPIILDSPSGKEVDQENIKLMMNILKRDFSDHQIIISSIFEYDFPNLNKIEIEKRLINKLVKP